MCKIRTNLFAKVKHKDRDQNWRFYLLAILLNEIASSWQTDRVVVEHLLWYPRRSQVLLFLYLEIDDNLSVKKTLTQGRWQKCKQIKYVTKTRQWESSKNLISISFNFSATDVFIHNTSRLKKVCSRNSQSSHSCSTMRVEKKTKTLRMCLGQRYK